MTVEERLENICNQIEDMKDENRVLRAKVISLEEDFIRCRGALQEAAQRANRAEGALSLLEEA